MFGRRRAKPVDILISGRGGEEAQRIVRRRLMKVLNERRVHVDGEPVAISARVVKVRKKSPPPQSYREPWDTTVEIPRPDELADCGPIRVAK